MKNSFIPLSVPEIKGNEWKYVKECLDTAWVSSVGSYVERFEDTVARRAGRNYAVACSSGTAALHIALLVSGLQAGGEVIMPSLSFAAPAFAVRYLGASPVFIDVEPDFWQLDIQKLEDFLTKGCKFIRGRLINRQTKRSVRAILPVHLLGHPVDMSALLKLARRFGLMVIEDAAESIGAKYKGKDVGGLGDFGCFSFNGNKIITSGGGGVIVTNDHKMAQRARHLTTQAKTDPVEYIHDEIGYNYRLTNIQAALGFAQMEVLDERLARKRKIAQKYHGELSAVDGITLPQEAPWAQSTWWLYTILVDKKLYGQDSRGLMHRLGEHGVQSRPLWHPLHSQQIFQGAYAHRMETTDLLYRSALSLPSSPQLTIKQQQYILSFIKQVKRKNN